MLPELSRCHLLPRVADAIIRIYIMLHGSKIDARAGGDSAARELMIESLADGIGVFVSAGQAKWQL